MIKISEIATNLTCRDNGIWFPAHRTFDQSLISFPETGYSFSLGIEGDSYWFRHRNNCIIQTMRLVPPDGEVFDVGAGNGYVSLALRNAGFDTVVIEPGLKGAKNAQARGLNPVICSTIEDCGFKPYSIPAIGMFDLLEHIDDDVALIATIKTLLTSNGRLYITVPAYDFLWSVDDEVAGHCRRYTKKTLTAILKSNGFGIDFATYIFSLLPFPIFLFRTIPSKLGFRRRNRRRRIRGEHSQKQWPLGFLLDWILKRELMALGSKKTIAFGGSCLVVARSS